MLKVDLVKQIANLKQQIKQKVHIINTLKDQCEKHSTELKDQCEKHSTELKREKKLADLIHREHIALKTRFDSLTVNNAKLINITDKRNELKSAIETTAAILCPNLELDGDKYDALSQIELALRHIYDITNA